MKLKLFQPLMLKFEQPNWARNPEFAVLDTILETHPELYKIAEADVRGQEKNTNLGRTDSPTVEQIVRASRYKELKGLDYRELEFAQTDCRICEQFVKTNPYSFQVLQKYIAGITTENLEKLTVAINKIAISEGL